MSRTSISFLAILRLLPSALFASIGGVLADSYDRRQIMCVLDCTGAVVAWLYILSYYLGSIYALYVATLLQMTVAALYEPSRTAIVPSLVIEGRIEESNDDIWPCVECNASSGKFNGWFVNSMGRHPNVLCI